MAQVALGVPVAAAVPEGRCPTTPQSSIKVVVQVDQVELGAQVDLVDLVDLEALADLVVMVLEVEKVELEALLKVDLLVPVEQVD